MKRLGLIILFLCLSILPIAAEPTFWEGNVEDIKEPGTYYVRVYTTDENGNIIETIVRTIITSDNTVIELEEAIDAQDFQAQQHEIEKLTHQQRIERAHAKAWHVETGDAIPIVESVVTKTADYQYEITFKTEKGTATTIQAIERSDAITTPVQWETIKYEPQTFKTLENRTFQMTILMLFALPLLLIFLGNLYFSKRVRDASRLLYNKT